MKERPIIFSTPMVRAILEGRKTQTRRIIKRPLQHPGWTTYRYFGPSKNNPSCPSMAIECGPDYPDDKEDQAPCPYGSAGDQLWVRESWRVGAWNENEGTIAVDYRADNYSRREWIDLSDADDEGLIFNRLWVQSCHDAMKAGLENGTDGRWTWEHGNSPCRWRPSIHMPRAVARITLELTEVRVERLQEISKEDAVSEGMERNHNGYFWGGPHAESGRKQHADPRLSYRDLWDQINAKRASWASNPWVWVIEFKRLP